MKYKQTFEIKRVYLDEKRASEFLMVVYGKRASQKAIKDLNTIHLNDPYFFTAKERKEVAI